MLKSQKGFTLIELVMIIVILGILAAVAVPKYVDMSVKANEAALKGVVGQINSASAMNFAAKKAGSGGETTTGEACDTAVGSILSGGTPDGYTVENKVLSAGTNTCTVTQDDTTETAEVNVLGV